MKMETFNLDLTADTSLLLTTLAGLVCALCDRDAASKEEDRSRIGNTVKAFIGRKLAEFQKIGEGTPYTEQEWAAKLITAGIAGYDAAVQHNVSAALYGAGDDSDS